jgi:hypothetical protein|tara:strand:+ start:420 stop:566 length:147 start_codon:yes stop_codon:yes gene_type:complete
MKIGIFLAGLGIFLYCITQAMLDISYFLELNNIRVEGIVEQGKDLINN